MRTRTPLWSTASVQIEQAEALSRALALPTRVARWLIARNVTSEAEARRFLYGREQYTSPDDFLDMNTAAQRIHAAIRHGETIVIVGDYDVDGVTASTILASELEIHGANWNCLIPERVSDGYGLSQGIVDEAKRLGGQLIVTVDNGIRAEEAILYAQSLGMEVIVTDHHEPGDTLPDCTALVHFVRHNDKDNAIVLSGAGVAWKLTQALKPLRPHGAPIPSDHDEWLMGLAALGAISDIMPMRAENRRLIREGLAHLRRCRRPGFLLLCEKGRVDLDQLSATAVSWKIAPRLNAAGRMAHAKIAFELFMARDRAVAFELVEEIERLNTERKKATDDAFEEAKRQVEMLYGGQAPSAIVVAGEWPLGVVGIVAARLCDAYTCPAIVLADLGEPVLRGSGRAPEGVSLHDALTACADLLHHFGGHAAAAGCGVEHTYLSAFRARFASVIESASTASGEVVAVLADDFLPLAEADLELLDWTKRFEPHGPENEPLRFFIGPSQVKRISLLGNGSHVRLTLAENAVERDVVWFNAPNWIRDPQVVGQVVGLVVEFEENIWQGRRRPQLRAVDGWTLDTPVVREVFAQFYRHLLKQRVVPRDVFEQMAERANVDDIDVILETFVELGFAAVDEGAYHVLEAVKSRDLREAVSYQSHLRERLIQAN